MVASNLLVEIRSTVALKKKAFEASAREIFPKRRSLDIMVPYCPKNISADISHFVQ